MAIEIGALRLKKAAVGNVFFGYFYLTVTWMNMDTCR